MLDEHSGMKVLYFTLSTLSPFICVCCSAFYFFPNSVLLFPLPFSMSREQQAAELGRRETAAVCHPELELCSEERPLLCSWQWLTASRAPWNKVLAAFVKEHLQWSWFLQFVSFSCKAAEYLGGLENLTAYCSPSTASRSSGKSVILLSFWLVLHMSLILPGRAWYLTSSKRINKKRGGEWFMSRVFSSFSLILMGRKVAFYWLEKQIFFILCDEAG